MVGTIGRSMCLGGVDAISNPQNATSTTFSGKPVYICLPQYRVGITRVLRVWGTTLYVGENRRSRKKKQKTGNEC